MNEEDQMDDVFIGKFLAGEATPEEAMTLYDSISISEKSENRFDEMKRVWALGTKNVNKTPTPNKEQVWKELQKRIQQEKPYIKTNVYAFYWVAAAVFLMISLSAFYFLWEPNKNLNEVGWETKKTHNEVTSISLADGSLVTVNRNSTLKWRKKLEGKKREVLLDGEAYFNVTHNLQKPFVINLDEIQIRVVGTAFNVFSKKEKDEIETEVTRGKVIMASRQKQISIEAGMKGIYNRNTKELTLVHSLNLNNIAYSTHTLSFTATKLSEVSKQLSKAYGVKFVFVDKKIGDCLLTSQYNNQSLSFILDIIAESLNITYILKDNIVYFSGNGCL